MAQKQKYWFKAKRYGYGWSRPLTREGWAVYAIYFGCVALFLSLVSLYQPPKLSDEAYAKLVAGGFFVQIFILTPILAFICFKKGEPAHWRWGKKK